LQVFASDHGYEVAVGLVWRTVLLAGDRQAGANLAQAAGATHFTVVGGATQTVGYGILPRPKRGLVSEQLSGLRSGAKKQATPVPLAVLVARSIGNSAALVVLDLTALMGSSEALHAGETYWLCSIRAGSPLGPEETVGSRQELQDILNEASLRAAQNEGDGFTLYTDLDLQGDESNSLQFPIKALNVSEVLRQSMSAQDAMQEVRKASSKSSAPAPALIGLCLAGAGLAGYSYYEQDQAESAAQAVLAAQAAAAQTRVIDPAALWNAAVHQATKGAHVANVQSLKDLRAALGKLPVDWMGWDLRAATCEAHESGTAKSIAIAASAPAASAPAGVAGSVNIAPQITWDCQAQYVPGTAKALVATNAQLNQATPAGFSATFEPTTKAALNWRVLQSAEPLDIATVPSQSQALIDFASALQDLSPQLTEKPNFSFAPMPGLVAPKDARGMPLVQPRSIEMPLQANITLKGPLRTLDLLTQRGVAAHWTKLTVRVAQALPLADAPSPAANAPSALTFDLGGVIYAKN
jgi:hypothetical protein